MYVSKSFEKIEYLPVTVRSQLYFLLFLAHFISRRTFIVLIFDIVDGNL